MAATTLATCSCPPYLAAHCHVPTLRVFSSAPCRMDRTFSQLLSCVWRYDVPTCVGAGSRQTCRGIHIYPDAGGTGKREVRADSSVRGWQLPKTSARIFAMLLAVVSREPWCLRHSYAVHRSGSSNLLPATPNYGRLRSTTNCSGTRPFPFYHF